MRHDQPDEPDDARHRDAGANGRSDPRNQQPQQAVGIDPQRPGDRFAQRQRIERAAAAPQHCHPQHHQRRGHPDIAPAAIGQRAVEPHDDLAHCKGIGRHADCQCGQRPGKAGDHQPGEREQRDPSGPAGNRGQQRHGAARADQREGGEQIGRSGIAEPQRGDRAQCRARRDTEQARIGQRIAQIALHGRAAHAQPGAHDDRQHSAGQAQFGEDQRGIGRACGVEPHPPRQQRQGQCDGQQSSEDRNRAIHDAAALIAANRSAARMMVGPPQ